VTTPADNHTLAPHVAWMLVCAAVIKRGGTAEDATTTLRAMGVADADAQKLFTDARALYPKLQNLLPSAALTVPTLQAHSIRDFMAQEFGAPDPLLTSADGRMMLEHPSLTQLHAYRGVGKSNLAFALGTAVADAGRWLRWSSPRPRRVLYVEGEQPSRSLQRKLRALVPEKSENFFLALREAQPDGRFPKIVTPEGRAAFERLIAQYSADVVILDSLSTLANVAMNDEENQLVLGDWLMHLRTVLRKSVIYLQHDGKTGLQRGHSKHEDWIDLSIHLKWPENYYGADGLRCHLEFDKAREPVPDGQNLLISLDTELGGDRPQWFWQEPTGAQDLRQRASTRVLEWLLESPDLSANTIVDRLRQDNLSYQKKEMLKMIAGVKETLRKVQDSPPVQRSLVNGGDEMERR